MASALVLKIPEALELSGFFTFQRPSSGLTNSWFDIELFITFLISQTRREAFFARLTLPVLYSENILSNVKY